MGSTSIILLLYIVLLILIILLIVLLFRIKNIEKKQLNFSSTEAYAMMQSMSDMLKESERVADRLDDSIKLKEQILEDMIDLIDAKIARFDNVLNRNKVEKDIRESIIELHESGLTVSDIARRLGISITEVQITLNIINSRRGE